MAQISSKLRKKGLIAAKTGRSDKRKTVLSLSEEGNKAATELAPLWNSVKTAVSDLLTEAAPDLMHSLKTLEDALTQKSFFERIIKQIETDKKRVEIIHYSPEYAAAFKTLNYEWLNKYFVVEEKDEEILSDPQREILDKGGEVLFALYESQPVGTCALMNRGPGIYELAKMAVTEKAQGLGIGKKLMTAAVEEAKRKGASKMVLVSNSILKTALTLYEKTGFKISDGFPELSVGYRRCDITMEMDL